VQNLSETLMSCFEMGSHRNVILFAMTGGKILKVNLYREDTTSEPPRQALA
jgi:hypothetical protein